MVKFFRQEEDKYKSIFELSPEAIVILDAIGTIIDINGRVYDWLGFKPEELIGKNIAEAPFLNKESQLRAEENFKKRMTGIEISPYELDFIKKNGGKVIGRVIGSWVRGRNNEISKVIIMISDITKNKEMESEIKNSEERYRNMISSSPDSITIADMEGKIIDCNQAAVDLLGAQNKTEIIGKNTIDFIAKKDQLVAKQNIAKTLESGVLRNVEYTFLTKEGREFPCELSASVLKDSAGKPLFFMSIAKDISERKRVERSKSEFTSIASHQLRTPLSIMSWYTEMILDGKAGKINKQQKKYLSEVYSANSKIIRLVNLLLNISRIDLGTFVINRNNIDLIHVIDNNLKILSGSIKDKEIKVEKQYKDKHLFIDTDENIVNIVLQNLLSNSVRYTPDGGKIIISLEMQKHGLLLRVSDNGYGIPANQQAQVFTKFFRGDNIKDKDTTGAGLGLFITKSVLKQLGGHIWFKSEEGRGSDFYVKLPLKMKK